MSLIAELKRRNVFRVGAAYGIVGWLLIEITATTFPILKLPDWSVTLVTALVLIGFPLAMILAWAFEMTPEGIKREAEVDRAESIRHQTGRKLDFIIIGVLAIGITYFAVDKFVLQPAPEPTEVTAESVAREKSIAVLPFVNMSSDPEQEYFSDGLSEEILNLLAKIPDLKVIGRTSSFAFKGKNEDLRLIGKALDVNTVLEGSVRKSGVRVRITAQLIDVASGAHLWSETYDRTLEDIFEVQDDVASAIFDALQVHVGTAPKRGRPTENAEAYALFLKARAAMNLPDAESAVELSLRAIELDPRFAEAHELLAYGYWWAAGYTMTPREAQLAVRRAATRAIELDPSLRFAQALAAGSSDENYYVEEIEALSRVILNKPNHAAAAETLLWDLTSTGYFAEATLLAKQLVDVDPLSAIAHYRMAHAQFAAGRTSDGLEALGFSAELGSESAKGELAWINLFDKSDKRAIERYQALLQQNDLPTAWVAELLEEASKPTTGEAYLDQHLPQIASSMSGGYYDGNLSSNLLGMYLKFGFLDRFYELIFEAGISASEWGPSEDYITLGISDRRSGFTAHPRFLELAEAHGLIELWDKRGPPDFCEKLSGQWVCE